MKLSTSNTFDVSQIADTNTYQEIQPFFDYINVFTSDVVQGFNNKITLTDNLDVSYVTLSLQHGVAVNIGQYTPVGVLIQATIPYTGYNLTTNADSTRNFSIYFKETHNIISKSAIWQSGTIVRYVVQNTAAYSVGDVVKFTQFGTANNNGSFLVTEVDLTNNYLYVNNRKRTSATGDETKVGPSGDVLTKHTVKVGLINA